MSPVSATTPTAIASATTQPSFTIMTIVQPAPFTTSTVSPTTVFVYSQEPPSQANTSTASRPLIPEPYNSMVMFIAAVGGIIYFIEYTIPHGKKKFMKWLWRKKIREQQLAKKREEKEEKREKKEAKLETRTYQLHQMQSAADFVKGQHAHVEESKGISESVEKVVTGVQVLPEAIMNSMAEVIKGAVKEGYENGAKDAIKGMGEIITKAVIEGTKNGYTEGFQDAMKGMEVIAKAVTKGTSEGIKDAMKEVSQTASDGVEKVVTAVQGIEEMMKVGLEEMDLRARSIEHRVDWMLDYHLDENERFGVLKAIFLGLLRKDDPPCDPHAFWGGDPVENQITINESNWENDKKPW